MAEPGRMVKTMSRESEIANLVGFVGALTLLIVVWRKLVLPNFRDSLRYRLFELRHELFMFMANGGVAADAPAYGHVRAAMNGWIRFAERLSFSRTLLLAVVAHDDLRVRTEKVETDLRSLDPHAREVLVQFRRRAGKVIAIYLVASSPLAWLILAVTIIRFALGRAWSIAWNAAFERLQAEGEVLGCLEDGKSPPQVAVAV
jgi:hypothetical protein